MCPILCVWGEKLFGFKNASRFFFSFIYLLLFSLFIHDTTTTSFITSSWEIFLNLFLLKNFRFLQKKNWNFISLHSWTMVLLKKLKIKILSFVCRTWKKKWNKNWDLCFLCNHQHHQNGSINFHFTDRKILFKQHFFGSLFSLSRSLALRIHNNIFFYAIGGWLIMNLFNFFFDV